MVDATVPQGYFAGKPPTMSDQLVSRMQRLPRRAGPQRLAVVAAPAAKAEDVRAFLDQDGLWRPRPKAPGVWEVDVLPDDIARFTGRADLFAWIDAATRLFGKAPAEGTVLAEVAATDPAAAEKRLKAAGGSVTGRSGTLVLARLPAAKLGELLKEPAIDAIEVK